MNRLIKTVMLFAGIVCLAGCTSTNPILDIEGGKVQGVETEVPGIFVYRGIPFAAAPVGDLRWKDPQPVTPWEGVLVADTFGSPCVQPAHTPGGYTPEFFFDGDPQFSEDCLYLNVWTPAAGHTNAKIPVVLWIHGGGYHAGWSSEPEMDGLEWAKHGCVLVTANYRLGVFGFFTHPLLSAESSHHTSGNYGMLDQIAALKWVKNNIEQFGGDPEKITIMGQSAGARSVQTLCASNLSKDLIAGAIIQSGGGISDPDSASGNRGGTMESGEAAGKKLMDWAGCETLEQMRSIPADTLFNLLDKYVEATGETLRISASPVSDGYACTESFSETVYDGTVADVPYMIGSTLDDMGALGNGIANFCLEREKKGGKAFAYQFARRLPTDGREGVLEGAFHSSELWYMFKSLKYCWRPFEEGDYELAEQMITYWSNFVKYGDPSGKNAGEWTPFTAENPDYMVFRLDENGDVASSMGPLMSK